MRRWEKQLVDVEHMQLLRWVPVGASIKRDKKARQPKRKKIFARLQRNANQPLTRALRNQLRNSGSLSIDIPKIETTAAAQPPAARVDDVAVPSDAKGADGAAPPEAKGNGNAAGGDTFDRNAIGGIISPTFLEHRSL